MPQGRRTIVSLSRPGAAAKDTVEIIRERGENPASITQAQKEKARVGRSHHAAVLIARAIVDRGEQMPLPRVLPAGIGDFLIRINPVSQRLDVLPCFGLGICGRALRDRLHHQNFEGTSQAGAILIA
ncbi:hypothetical protein Bind_1244 [Beijerinckia indica subsp. indica ATCC 9039]|uniref:Uncharacterized protein n=1 Tax=Beijerinckia indica subsp. indica (strain ATCC 9039 / DSM 1715 / NCIMB 8712) TaxID=395963 RepID=B2IJL4_BEII9|nr:hypothetical protein Bind_1244 [Beijerinckia indica subsp. indica ATCC 9039]